MVGNCIVCDIEVVRNPSGFTGNTYCSNKCQAVNRSKKKLDLWLAGEISGTTGDLTCNFVKRYIKERDNDSCTVCGQGNMWQGKPITIEIDHIDGVHSNSTPGNLRCICPNCHSQTDTFKNTKRKEGVDGSSRSGRK
jgi:hypothetical protein